MKDNSASISFPLYQAPKLAAYAKQLIHAFSGKPLSLGGGTLTLAERQNNRERFCEVLGISKAAQHLKAPDQVHSAISKLQKDPNLSHCDALILTEPNQPALVLVADCVPVMLYDFKQHIAAVIHAGWRGTAQAITQKTARRLIKEFSCSPDNLIAGIGPSIGRCCYQVSDEVLEAVGHTIPQIDRSHYATLEKNGKPNVDLKAVNRFQLEQLGIRQIDTLPHCTQCEATTFFSHRRGEGDRQAAVMMLKERCL